MKWSSCLILLNYKKRKVEVYNEIYKYITDCNIILKNTLNFEYIYVLIVKKCNMKPQRVLVEFFVHWAFSVFDPNLCTKMNMVWLLLDMQSAGILCLFRLSWTPSISVIGRSLNCISGVTAHNQMFSNVAALLSLNNTIFWRHRLLQSVYRG
jgi:hypothetical protein